MRHDARDCVVIGVGRRVRVRQYVARVEDVEPLVLHRAEVEIGDRDDVEHAQIIFSAVDPLVPTHRGLQRTHRMRGPREVLLANVDAKVDRAARAGDESVPVHRQIARDQREQIARLGEGVVPFGPVAAVVELTGRHRIAVREQHRVARLACAHPDAVAAEHVGAVGEEGDAAKAFRLALRAEDAARIVDTHQLSVGLGSDLDLGLDLGAIPGDRHRQQIVLVAVLDRLAVDGEAEQLQAFAVEHQRGVRDAIPLYPQHRAYDRPLRVQIELERDLRDQPVGRAIVFAANSGRGYGRGVQGVEHGRSIRPSGCCRKAP